MRRGMEKAPSGDRRHQKTGVCAGRRENGDCRDVEQGGSRNDLHQGVRENQNHPQHMGRSQCLPDAVSEAEAFETQETEGQQVSKVEGAPEMTVSRVIILVLLLAARGIASGEQKVPSADAFPRTFDRVMPLAFPRPQGPTPTSRSWDNSLTVGRDAITLKLKGGSSVTIDPRSVTAVRYTIKEAPEDTPRWVTLVTEGLMGLAIDALARRHSAQAEHYVFIEFDYRAGKPSGMILRADPANFQGILEALRAVTVLDPNRPDPSPRDPLGCGPAAEKLTGQVRNDVHPMPEPSPGKAIVYWYWAKGDKVIRGWRIGVNGEWVGMTWPHAYFYLEVNPGLAKVCYDINGGLMPGWIVAEAGKTYYLGSGKGEEGHKRLLHTVPYVTFERKP